MNSILNKCTIGTTHGVPSLECNMDKDEIVFLGQYNNRVITIYKTELGIYYIHQIGTFTNLPHRPAYYTDDEALFIINEFEIKDILNMIRQEYTTDMRIIISL